MGTLLWQMHSTTGQPVPPRQASPQFVTRSTLSTLRLRSATLPGFHSMRTFLAMVWADQQSLPLLIFLLAPQPAPSPLHAVVVVTFSLVPLPAIQPLSQVNGQPLLRPKTEVLTLWREPTLGRILLWYRRPLTSHLTQRPGLL